MANGEVLAELVLQGEQDFQQGMQDAAQATTEVGDDAADAAQGTDEMADSLVSLDNKAGIAAGAGLAAVGGAITGIAEDTKEMRSGLNQTAVTMGITQDEANNLARSISDATFPLEDAEATMSELAKAGIEDQEVMEELALEFDNVADATGHSAEEMTQTLGPAMRAMGDDFEDIGEHQDTFTYLQQETTMELSEFSNMIERVGPDLQDLGFELDDAAAAMAAMEEQGIRSREARQRLNQAVEEGVEDTGELADELGISEEALEEQMATMEDAEGITDEYSEAANETVTTTDRLRHRFEEAKLAAGGLIGPVESAGPALMGMGGAMSTLSTINMTAAVPSLGAVYASLAPLLPVLLPLIAVVGALAAAWATDFMGIRDVTDNTISAVMGWLQSLAERFQRFGDRVQSYLQPYINILQGEAMQTVQVWADAINSYLGQGEQRFNSFTSTVSSTVEPFIQRMQPLAEIWLGTWQEVIGSTLSIITTTVEGGMDTIYTAVRAALALLRGDWEEAWNLMSDLMDRQMDRVVSIAEDTVDLIRAPFEGLADIGREAAEGLMGSFEDGIRDMASAPVDAVEGAVSSVRDRLPGSDADTGPLSDISTTGDALMNTFTQGIEDLADKPEEKLEDALDGVRDKLPFSDAQDGPLQDLTKSGQAFSQTWAEGIEDEADAPAEAVAGVTEEVAEETTGVDAATPSGTVSGSDTGQEQAQTIEVDARMEEGAIQFNGITWSEALDKVRDIIDSRFKQIERNIKRKYLRGDTQ